MDNAPFYTPGQRTPTILVCKDDYRVLFEEYGDTQIIKVIKYTKTPNGLQQETVVELKK